MILYDLYNQADYKDKAGMMFNADCLDIMAKIYIVPHNGVMNIYD